MNFRIKPRIFLATATWVLAGVACSPKATDSDTAVADATIGDLPMDMVIPPNDSATDSAAAPELVVADEIGGGVEVDVVIDADEVVDVLIPPDILPDQVADAVDLDELDAAEVVDVVIPPDLLPDTIADTAEIDQIGDVDVAKLDQTDTEETKSNDAQLPVPDLGPCVSKDLVVYADSLSDDSLCVKPCPTDHPCICGDCAWVQTPPTVQPRWGASAVWTGTEIVLVGGWPGAFPQYPITAERWNPKAGKGWEMINTPVTKAVTRSVEAHWDGAYVWAIVQAPTYFEKEEYSFRWDPNTNKSVKLVMPGRLQATSGPTERRSVWVNGKVFEEGKVTIDQVNGISEYAFALYDPAADLWKKQEFPGAWVVNNQNPEGLTTDTCLISSGDDVFIYNSGFKPNPASGLDEKKVITLRFHAPDATWSVISQAMPIDTITDLCGGFGFDVGTETGFVVWGEKFGGGAPSYGKPAQGAIYNKQTDTWTLMTALAPNAFAASTHRQTQVVGDVIYAYGQSFLDSSKPEALKFYKVNTVAEFHISTNSWNFLTPVGFPTDSRQETGFVLGDNELYLIGGIDGPANANIIHQDGVRLALPGSKP